jgi:hypothetical protein
MNARFVGRLGGVLACAVVAACSASQPAAPANTGPEELNYSREMPNIATGDLAARGTVASSSDQTPFDFSELPAGSTVWCDFRPQAAVRFYPYAVSLAGSSMTKKSMNAQSCLEVGSR